GLQRAIAVGKDLGDEKLVALRGAEHSRDVMPESWRTPANIDGNIEDRTGRDAQQLGLGERRGLEMQAAQHACAHRQRVIVLDKVNVNSVLPQHVFLEYLGEKPA